MKAPILEKGTNQLVPLTFFGMLSLSLHILGHDEMKKWQYLTKKNYRVISKMLVGSHSITQYFLRGYSWMSVFYLFLNFVAYMLHFDLLNLNDNFYTVRFVGWLMASYGPARLVINWKGYNNKKRFTMGTLIAISFMILFYGKYMSDHSELLIRISGLLQCSSGLFSFIFETSPIHKRNLGLIIILALGILFTGNFSSIVPEKLRRDIMVIPQWMLSGYGPGRFAREKKETIKKIMKYLIPISILVQSVGFYYIINGAESYGRWWKGLGVWLTCALSVGAISTKILTKDEL